MTKPELRVAILSISTVLHCLPQCSPQRCMWGRSTHDRDGQETCPGIELESQTCPALRTRVIKDHVSQLSLCSSSHSRGAKQFPRPHHRWAMGLFLMTTSVLLQMSVGFFLEKCRWRREKWWRQETRAQKEVLMCCHEGKETIPFQPRCRCDSWCRAAGSWSFWGCRLDGHWKPPLSLLEAGDCWEEEGDSNSSRKWPILRSSWSGCAG